MKLNDLVVKRFRELEDQKQRIPTKGNSIGVVFSRPEPRIAWITSALSLLQKVFGEASPHYQSFKKYYEKWDVYSDLEEMWGVFLAAKADYDGGYLFELDASISGEIFGDFVALAKQALSEDHKDVAAVLACAALEDALKRYAFKEGLDIQGKDMQAIVNMLKAEGFIGGAQKSLLDVMPRIRNMAMHADWAKITAADVNSVIGFVERFLLDNF